MNLRNIVTLLLLHYFSLNIYAQYRVNDIPGHLKENAHCIIREYSRLLEIKSVNTSTEKVKKVITILDKPGEESAYLAVAYDRNRSVTINRILYYDANGEKIKTAKASEIQDHPYAANSELFSDSRIKLYVPKNSGFPYSIEYDYEIYSGNDISYGCWRPVTTYNTSLQHAKMVLIHPSKYKINCKESGVEKRGSETIKNQNILTWEMDNIEAYEEEPFSVSLSELVPRVYLMPDNLIYDGYKGSSSNWKSFGTWIFKLYEDRNLLPVDFTERIKEMVSGFDDTITRMRKLYEYLQKNTRYVAITLGIGGYQPSSAESVLKTGFGDCKALCNYMSSLLDCIGVKSYPALVASGNYQVPIYKEFPNFQQFDHVILCIPNNKDTIWLECTDPLMPFGFLGDFTDDRNVLLITEQGGVFAHTAVYDESDNKRTCQTGIKLDSKGSAVISTKTSLHGLQYDDVRQLVSSNPDEQKKQLLQNSKTPSYSITSFSVIENRLPEPYTVISEEAQSKNYCNISGNYMIVPLNTINPQEPIRKMLKRRQSDIIISRSFTDYDTVTISYPENLVFESLPSGKTFKSEFGEYSCSVDQTEKALVYRRYFKINKGRFTPEKYLAFYNFILDVSKADNMKVLLYNK